MWQPRLFSAGVTGCCRRLKPNGPGASKHHGLTAVVPVVSCFLLPVPLPPYQIESRQAVLTPVHGFKTMP